MEAEGEEVMKTESDETSAETQPTFTDPGDTPEARIAAICARTGYSHDITTGQRKYGGPPPNWEGPAPPAGCEVYCGKIPNTILEDELIPLFEKCGTIYDFRLMMDPATGQGRGFCFCIFSDKQGAEEACKQLDGYAIRGNKRLKVNISIPNARLFVGNIPKSKSKDDIVQEMSKLTDGLQDVIIYSVPDDPKKKNRGFAFVDYDSHKSASNAKKRLSSGRVRVFGCDVIVDWADPLDEPDSETMAKVKVLYVRNLKSDVTEEQLMQTFSEYGKIEKVKKVKDYGFVHFIEREDAVAALEALDGKMINDSKMLVSLAKPPTDSKLKEQRKFQHMQLFNGGRGPMMGDRRGGRGMRGGPMGGLRGAPGVVAFRGMTAGYNSMDYGGYDEYGMSDYGYGMEGYDDYSYGGYGAGYDSYGYEDYDYYGMGMGGGMSGGYGLAGAPRGGRARGVASLAAGMGRGARGSMGARPMRGAGMGALGSRGMARGAARGAARSRPAFGRGANGAGMSGGRGAGTAARGIKRKAASDFNQSSATKKPYTQDSWTTQPIAQQPLGQMGGYGAGAGESEWYQDSFAGAQWE